MVGTFIHSVRQIRRSAIAALAAATMVWAGLFTPALARGPDKIADVAEQVIEAVVNISTSQTVESRNTPMPNIQPGSPFEEFFQEFFRERRGQGDQNRERMPRRTNSLGSGFVLDPEGIVVTNNHVISEADEITVVFNDGSKLKAEVIGRDQKTDLALLRVKPTKPLKAVKFGDSDKLRLGEWVIAIGNPFMLGGSVTAGIDDKGPAKPAGIEPGDVVIKFDGRDIREMRDLPRIVADTPVGKDVEVVIVRKGKEETRTVKLGRLEDGERERQAAVKKDAVPEDRSTVKKTLGLELSNLSDDLRRRYKIKDGVKGVLVTGVDAGSAAADKRLSAGDVIVEVAQESVATAAD